MRETWTPNEDRRIWEHLTYRSGALFGEETYRVDDEGRLVEQQIELSSGFTAQRRWHYESDGSSRLEELDPDTGSWTSFDVGEVGTPHSYGYEDTCGGIAVPAGFRYDPVFRIPGTSVRKERLPQMWGLSKSRNQAWGRVRSRSHSPKA